jgi:hypothetical protein
MEALDPARALEQRLSGGGVPSLGGDATELKLDAVLEPVTAGMSQLAPGAQGEREVVVSDEVVAGDAILVSLGGEYNEEILGVVDVDGEVAGQQLERSAEGRRHLVHRDLRPRSCDGSHHGAPQRRLGLLHLDGARDEDALRSRGTGRR